MRSDAELAAVDKRQEDIAIAQLHYTVMLHLGRAFDLRTEMDRHGFVAAFVALAGASDCAAELLQRVATPGVYDAWSEKEGKKHVGVGAARTDGLSRTSMTTGTSSCTEASCLR